MTHTLNDKYTSVLSAIFGNLDNRESRDKVTRCILRNSDIDGMKWLLAAYPSLHMQYNGHPYRIFDCTIEFIRYLVQDVGLVLDNKARTEIFRTGSVSKVEYIIDELDVDYMLFIEAACDYENIPVLEHLFTRYPECDVDHMFQHACNQRNNVARWMLSKYDIDVYANNCVAFRNIINDANKNRQLLVDHTTDKDISFHCEHITFENGGYIISTHDLGDIWNHGHYIEEYDMYVYSDIEHTNYAQLPFVIFGIYVKRQHQRAIKSASKVC